MDKGKLTWEEIKKILWENFKNIPKNAWEDLVNTFNWPIEHPAETSLLVLFGQVTYGPKTFDTIPPGYRVSPYRLTHAGETYIRFESTKLSSKISHGRVSPNSFAAKISGEMPTQQQLNKLYNLPAKDIPRDAYYIIKAKPGQWIEGPKPVTGGAGEEVRFQFGAEADIAGPFNVPK